MRIDDWLHSLMFWFVMSPPGLSCPRIGRFDEWFVRALLSVRGVFCGSARQSGLGLLRSSSSVSDSELRRVCFVVLCLFFFVFLFFFFGVPS